MSEVATFNAHPTVAVRAESPLAFNRVGVAVQASAQGAGVCIRERALLGHLILRGNAADEAFRAGRMPRKLYAASPSSPTTGMIGAK